MAKKRPKYFDIIDNEMVLRKLLWLRHGCPIHILYGDDGEMQCGNCGIDFKRDDGNQIEKRFETLGLEKMMRDGGA